MRPALFRLTAHYLGTLVDQSRLLSCASRPSALPITLHIGIRTSPSRVLERSHLHCDFATGMQGPLQPDS